MEITYDLEAEDIKEFQKYHYRGNKAIKKFYVFTYLLLMVLSYFPLLYLLLFTDFLSDFHWKIFWAYLLNGTLTFLVVSVVTKAIDYFWRKYSINAYIEKHKNGDGILGRHQIRFDEIQFVEITDVSQTNYSWKGVDRIEENEDYIFIFIAPSQAHIIPKRAFDDSENALVFAEEARRLKELAKTNFSPSYLASNDQIK